MGIRLVVLAAGRPRCPVAHPLCRVDPIPGQGQRRFYRLLLDTWDGGQDRGPGGSQPRAATALSAATGGDLSRDLFWREILGSAGAGDVVDVRGCSLLLLGRTSWTTPGILEAMKPGRMQGHGGTAEVPG